MKKDFMRFLLALVILIGLCTQGYAQDNSIHLFNLKNGQTLIVKEVHSNPIVTVDTWVRTGSVNETAKNNGVSHFLEHLLFKGTEKHKLGEIENILESKGAVFNAATSKDYTHFYITTASRYFDEALDLHSDMLLNATIPQPELDRERKVVQEEIRRSKDNPGTILFNNMASNLFKGHPYSKETLGTTEIIGSIPRQDIMDYYRTWYVPPNMITIIVGDVNTDKVVSLVQQKFGGREYRKPIAVKYPIPASIKKAEEKLEYGDYNTGYSILGFRGVPITDKKDNYALDIAAIILGDGRTSRLYQGVKEKADIVNNISSGHYSMKDSSIFYVSSDFKPENYDKLKSAITKEIDRMRTEGVTEQELARAKTKVLRSFQYENESVEDIAGSIGYIMTIDGNLKSYTDYVENVSKIQADDVKKALNKFVLEHKSVTSTLLPKPQKSAMLPVADIKAKTVRTVLPTGMTVITDKNTSNDIISLSVFVKGGQFIETKAGINSLIADTLTKGTQTKTALQISTELENSGIVISPSANPDYFEIQLKSVNTDFEKALGILKDIVNNPTFPQEHIDKSKSDIIESIRESRDNPSTYAFEKFSLAMFKNHPYGKIGPVIEQQLPTITRDEMIKYYNTYFVPANMIVSVSGNVNADEINRKLADVFPSKTGQKVDMAKLTAIPLNPSDRDVAIKKDVSTAWLDLGWAAPGITSAKDYASLKVVSAMLGNGLSSRLFSTLREKQGLAYEVSTIYPTRLDNTFFVLYIGTAPQNLAVAKQGFLGEINRIKTDPVSEKELAEVKQKIIGQYALAQETNQQKAHYLGWFETLGQGYEFNEKYPELINSVTAEDVRAVANKYFSGQYIQSAIGPSQSIDNLEKENKGESKR